MSDEDRGVERVVLEGVTKRFGSIVALRGVSAEFERGRVTLVTGANGSGKSTLLGVIGTTLQATSGRVLYEPFGERASVARRHIGWLSHESLSYADLTGKRNVELAAELHGLPADLAWERAQSRFELGAFALRPVRTNSRGQRQRIALARALVHEPTLVLLDEPTTGLDTAGVRGMLDVVRSCIERRAVVIVVAHDPETFEEMGPDRVHLERGRVVED